MESLRPHPNHPDRNRQPIPRHHFPHKMRVVLHIHRPGPAIHMPRLSQSNRRIERIARIVEHPDKMPDVHMLIAVRPLRPRHRLVTGRSQLLNLLSRKMRWLHP